MTHARLAIAQAPSLPGRVADNARRAGELIEAAARTGAGYVVLPELFLCGYDIDGIIAEPERHVLTVEDDPCRSLRQACASHRIAAVVGGAFAIGGELANGAVAIAPDGEIVHVYRKAHLWGPEADAFDPGGEPCLLSFPDLKLGLGICFDAGFPEHARSLAMAGADAIAFPSAFTEGAERRRYELYFPTRALENTVYVAVANAVGEQGGVAMFGDSLLIGPRGDERARIGADTGIEIVEIDRGEIAGARGDLPYLDSLTDREATPITIEWS